MRRAAGAAAIAAAALGWAGPAGALPILEPADAEELAAELAEAAADHGICYGWSVEVFDEGGSGDGVDAGSDRGAGRPVDRDACSRWMEVQASVRYTSEWSESEDSASVGVDTNLDFPPGEPDLARLGVSGDRFLGADDDVALADAAAALPVLAVEGGHARAEPAAPDAEAVPPADGPARAPGSDFLRTYTGPLVLSGAAVAAGLGWGAYVVGTAPRARPVPRRRPRRTDGRAG